MMYTSSGLLRYSLGTAGHRLVLEADQQLADYYYALLPFRANRQLYPAHVSVVRRETPLPDAWGRHEGLEVEFLYDPEVKVGTTYVWLNVFSKRLEEVRRELGLPVDNPFTRPPDGLAKTFHLTVANFKNISTCGGAAPAA